MTTTKTDKRMAELKAFIRQAQDHEHANSFLIAILHKAQELYGYLSEEVMNKVAEEMNIPRAHIWGVATFYHYFRLKPKGKYVVSVCLGTACFVKGAKEVLEAIKDELKLDIGGTTEDKLFTLAETRCLGACGLAPVIMINDKIYGELTEKSVVKLLKKYRNEKK